MAEEEERIKDLRTTAEATRQKETVRIAAEARAQDHLVTQIKAAEAAEEVAKHQAKVKITQAEADLEASDKQARAKIRLAEGVQAEAAAEGLAQIRVKEADAQAIEKVGLSEAKVAFEKLQAQASGDEKLGMAKVKVAEAEAQAIEKKGLAEALVVKERLNAEASGAEQMGLAKAKVANAEAEAIQLKGAAEADASRQRFAAEASGIQEKAAAMKNLDADSRDHEEFRIRLQANKDVAMQSLDTRIKIAEQQAKILAQAFEQAKIQIIGGDGRFFDQFVKAVSFGQSADAVVDQSETIKTVLGDYLNGNKSLTADIKEILERPAVSSETAKNLTISAVLGKLMAGTDGEARDKIAKLAQRAKEMGIDDLGTG